MTRLARPRPARSALLLAPLLLAGLVGASAAQAAPVGAETPELVVVLDSSGLDGRGRRGRRPDPDGRGQAGRRRDGRAGAGLGPGRAADLRRRGGLRGAGRLRGHDAQGPGRPGRPGGHHVGRPGPGPARRHPHRHLAAGGGGRPHHHRPPLDRPGLRRRADLRPRPVRGRRRAEGAGGGPADRRGRVPGRRAGAADPRVRRRGRRRDLRRRRRRRRRHRGAGHEPRPGVPGLPARGDAGRRARRPRPGPRRSRRGSTWTRSPWTATKHYLVDVPGGVDAARRGHHHARGRPAAPGGAGVRDHDGETTSADPVQCVSRPRHRQPARLLAAQRGSAHAGPRRCATAGRAGGVRRRRAVPADGRVDGERQARGRSPWSSSSTSSRPSSGPAAPGTEGDETTVYPELAAAARPARPSTGAAASTTPRRWSRARYSDSMRIGETVFYRVPVGLGPAAGRPGRLPARGRGLRAGRGPRCAADYANLMLFDPTRGHAYPNGDQEQAVHGRSRTRAATWPITTHPVVWANRGGDGLRRGAAAEPSRGLYVMLSMDSDDTSVDAQGLAVPYTVSVDVLGEAQEGPTYATASAQDDSAPQDDASAPAPASEPAPSPSVEASPVAVENLATGAGRRGRRRRAAAGPADHGRGAARRPARAGGLGRAPLTDEPVLAGRRRTVRPLPGLAGDLAGDQPATTAATAARTPARAAASPATAGRYQRGSGRGGPVPRRAGGSPVGAPASGRGRPGPGWRGRGSPGGGHGSDRRRPGRVLGRPVAGAAAARGRRGDGDRGRAVSSAAPPRSTPRAGAAGGAAPAAPRRRRPAAAAPAGRARWRRRGAGGRAPPRRTGAGAPGPPRAATGARRPPATGRRRRRAARAGRAGSSSAAGRCPLSASTATTPADHRSEAGEGSPPRTSSGAR